jgi:PAS domain S-box-containing protein
MLEKCLRRFFFSGAEQRKAQAEASRRRIAKLTKRIEQQMSDYDMLLNGVDTMIWLNYEPDVQGKSNQAVLDFFGTTSEELEGKKIRDLLPPEEAEICIQNNKEILETGKGKVTHEWATRFDGKKRLLKVTKNPKINGVSYIVASAEDITELEETRTKLRDECSFTESLIDTARAIMLVLDRDANIVRCNKYFERITGYKFKEIEGKNWFDLFIKEANRARLETIFSELSPNTTKFDDAGVINAIKTKDGKEVIIEWFSTPLTDNLNSIIGVISVGQDVTEKKILTEELWSKIIELEARLQQVGSQKMPVRKENKGDEVILLVDDAPAIVEVTSKILQQHGYRVLEADSASAALTYLALPEVEIDMLITDLFMHPVDGLELLSKVQDKNPDIKHLLISGIDPTTSAPISSENFLQKPFMFDEFISKVRRILDSGKSELTKILGTE